MCSRLPLRIGGFEIAVGMSYRRFDSEHEPRRYAGGLPGGVCIASSYSLAGCIPDWTIDVSRNSWYFSLEFLALGVYSGAEEEAIRTTPFVGYRIQWTCALPMDLLDGQ